MAFRQLAGGVTTANLLHGSCNAIGGQNAVIKFRWGRDPEGLVFAREASTSELPGPGEEAAVPSDHGGPERSGEWLSSACCTN